MIDGKGMVGGGGWDQGAEKNRDGGEFGETSGKTNRREAAQREINKEMHIPNAFSIALV